MKDDLGTYVEHEGRPAVRFVRTYRHPVERVWTAVSDPAELQHWFPSKVEIEPREGGRIAFADDPYAAAADGTILVWDPPHRLAFTWYEDELHLTLEPTGDGWCRLTLVNVLDDRSAAARNAGGWYVCLDVLGKRLDGVPTSGPHGDVAEWEPILQAHVDAGLPSGASIPDPVDR
ncbi:SRPBCC family protein [Geodermatophilus sp. SYSU D00691]